MDSILSAINEYRIILGAIVLTVVTVLLIKKYWEEVSFFVLRTTMNAPLFGKIDRLSRNPARKENGWFHSEEDLCAEFSPYFKNMDESADFYDKSINYLKKVGELDRKKLGIFGWTLICGMVFIEAMGFSYVLAGFTIPGASESLQQQGAIGIALLLSGLLVAMTHLSGHELYKNGLLKKSRVWWTQSSTNDSMEPNNEVSLKDDHVDDNDPNWRKILSRVNTNAEAKPTYFVTLCTAILVVAVAVGATYVRGQVLEQQQMEAHSGEGVFGETATAGSDPYASNVPAELLAAQDETDRALGDQINERILKGGWATFIVLAVIFVFLQILGVVIGIKTGFAGIESHKAYKFSHKFNNRDEFETYHERKRNLVAQIAQRNLTKLQARMAKKLGATATNKETLASLQNGNGRSFIAYTKQTSEDQSAADIEHARTRRERD